MNGKAERPADKKLAQGLPASSEARLGWNRSLWALDTPSLCQHRLSHLLAPSCLRCHHSFKLGSLQSLPPPPSPHFPPPPTSKTSNPSVIKKNADGPTTPWSPSAQDKEPRLNSSEAHSGHEGQSPLPSTCLYRAVFPSNNLGLCSPTG